MACMMRMGYASAGSWARTPSARSAICDRHLSISCTQSQMGQMACQSLHRLLDRQICKQNLNMRFQESNWSNNGVKKTSCLLLFCMTHASDQPAGDWSINTRERPSAEGADSRANAIILYLTLACSV